MKKKIIAAVLALSMVFSSASFTVFADDTVAAEQTEALETSEDSLEEETAEVSDEVSLNDATEVTSPAGVDLSQAVEDGWKFINTGGSTSVMSGDFKSGVTINETAAAKGKWSGSSDEVAWYGVPVDPTKDFTLSADVVINEMNVSGNGSANQSTAGLVVFSGGSWEKDMKWSSKKQPNSVAVSLYQSGGDYTDFCGNYRVDPSARAEWSAPLAKDVITLKGGLNSDSHSLKLTKRGSIYTVYADGNTWFVKDAGNIMSGSKIYPGLFQARQCKVTFTNVKLDVEQREVTSLEITNPPNATEFVLGNKPNLEGMVVTAKYSDGTTEVLEDDGYAVDVDINKEGSQQVLVVKGGASTPLTLTYGKNKPVKINVITAPMKTEYFIGQLINADGLEVEAEFLDGSKAALSNEEYTLSLGGKELTDTTYIDANMAKDKSVKIKFAPTTDAFEAGTAYGEVPVTIHKDYSLDSIKISSKPVKTTYYTYYSEENKAWVGEDFDPTGLYIKANYKDAAGNIKSDYLSASEYVLDADEFNKTNKTKAGDYKIRASYAADKNVFLDIDVTVKVREVIKMRITGYPVMTYDLNAGANPKDVFVRKGLEVSYLYSSGELAPIDLRKVIYGPGDEEVINQYGVYDLDLTQFSVSEESTADNPKSFITVVPVEERFGKTTLPVTVRVQDDHFWSYVHQGESVSSSKCYVKNITGTYTDPEAEGTKFSLASIGGGGKISTDQDGIAYVYTRIDSDNNFRLSADITVTSYLSKDFDDTARAGQEAFGIMARDNVLMTPSEEFKKTPEYTGQNWISRYAWARKDANGREERKSTGEKYSANFVMVGGCTFGAYPTNPDSPTYEKNRDLNRINLGVRYGSQSHVMTEVGSPTRAIPTSTMTKNMFKKNDKFHLTLERVNGGYKAIAYDYQEGTTEVRYWYPEGGETLTTIDPDSFYVGFFCARNASIDVENVDFHVTDPATDLTSRTSGVAAVAPKVMITSSEVTGNKNYNLAFKANNKSGGYVTIKQDDKVLVTHMPVSKKSSVLPVTLKENAKTTFKVVYTPKIVSEDDPNYEILTSTADTSQTFVVTHNSKFNTSADRIYVAPNGSIDGEGTKESPLDLDTALGFVKRGQTIVMMDGVYLRDRTITIPSTKSGTKNERIRLIADEGAQPIIDAQRKYLGMTLEASYWDVKGIDIRHAANNQRGMQLSGNYCVIEDCKIYDNGDTGFQLSRTDSTANSMRTWPHNNLIKNCEVWNNADPSGNNADGFGCKLTVGYNNVFEGCVSHHNLDDGWDLYTKSGTGPIAPVTLINCISYQQGYVLNEDGTSSERSKGGWNGLKLGGESIPVQHFIRNCKTFYNRASGVSSNSNPQLTARDCVSYNNRGGNFSLSTSNSSVRHYNYDLKGIVSYKDENTLFTLDKNGKKVIATDSIKAVQVENKDGKEVYKEVNIEPKDYNYINGKNAKGDIVDETFFKSLDMDAVIKNGHFAQDADGNFITGDFLELTDAAKAAITGAPGYEDAEESTTESTTQYVKDTSGTSGGGSPKKSDSSTTTDKDKDKTDKDKTENEKKEDDKKTEDGKKEDDKKTEDDKTDNDKSEKDDSSVSNKVPDDKGHADKFTDLAGNWAKPYISALVEEGVINGVSDTEFAPNAKITRADFSLMLIKALGMSSEEPHGFSDVNAGDYYSDAIAAAKAYGLVKGTSDVTFSPKANITRQDAVSIIARTLDAIGYTEGKAGDLSVFADASLIASYAKAPFEKLVGLGFVNGNNGMVNPTTNISRAEAAKLIYDVLQTKKTVE